MIRLTSLAIVLLTICSVLRAQIEAHSLENWQAVASSQGDLHMDANKLTGALPQMTWIDNAECFVLGDHRGVYGFNKQCEKVWTVPARDTIQGWTTFGNDLYVVDGAVIGLYDISSFQGDTIKYPINAVSLTAKRNKEAFSHYGHNDRKTDYDNFFKVKAPFKISPPVMLPAPISGFDSDYVFIMIDRGLIAGFQRNLSTKKRFLFDIGKDNPPHPLPSKLELYTSKRKGAAAIGYPTWGDKVVYFQVDIPKNLTLVNPIKFDETIIARENDRKRLQAAMMEEQKCVSLEAYASVVRSAKPNEYFTLITKPNSIIYGGTQPAYLPYTSLAVVSSAQPLPAFTNKRPNAAPDHQSEVRMGALGGFKNNWSPILPPYLMQEGDILYVYTFESNITWKNWDIQMRKYKVPSSANNKFTNQWRQNWQQEYNGNGPMHLAGQTTDAQLKTLVENDFSSYSSSAYNSGFGAFPTVVPISPGAVVRDWEQPKQFQGMNNELRRLLDITEVQSNGVFRLVNLDYAPQNIRQTVAYNTGYQLRATLYNKYLTQTETNGTKVFPLDTLKSDEQRLRNFWPGWYDRIDQALTQRQNYWRQTYVPPPPPPPGSIEAWAMANSPVRQNNPIDYYGDMIKGWRALTFDQNTKSWKPNPNSGMYQFKDRMRQIAGHYQTVIRYLEHTIPYEFGRGPTWCQWHDAAPYIQGL